jgi:hypothetical protein
LKLSQLLSQFLYQTRKLDLPGIGTFTLDPAAVIPEESERGGTSPAAGISFKNANIPSPDDALISFIKDHTGKMKPLAAADLDFYLTTGKQLLNIGKPFYLEGIGTLMQNKEGRLDFTPGEYMIARLDEPAGRKDRAEKRVSDFDEPPREYEPRSNTIRQSMLLLGIIGGLIIIGWGGYYLYKRNTYVEPTENTVKVLPDSAPARKDSATIAQSGRRGDTTAMQQKEGNPAAATSQKPVTTTAAAPPAGNLNTAIPVPGPGESLYRFIILRTPNKGHALRRYNQLLGYQLNIKMETKDSSFFKLYFPIPAAIRDTAHIRDSLADVYAAHVIIEQ